MRSALAVVVAALLGSAGCPRPQSPRTAHRKPKIVVAIVIDQLPAWSFEKRRHLLKHGIGRLLKEGVHVVRAEYPYAFTYTSPGHATLATGATPSVTGVIANSWWRRDEGKLRGAEYDPDATVLAVPGTDASALTPDDAASGKALRVDGIADVLRTATGGRSVAIALKARSACFIAGKRPDVVLWYEEAIGSFTTSVAYADKVPGWVGTAPPQRPATRFADAVWTADDPALLARETGLADDAPGEGDQHGLGRAFPHSLATAADPKKGFLLTPFADEMITDVAIAALEGEHLGDDDIPDYLAISYSSHDLAGHNWGPDSWETLDLLLRLDAQIGRLLDTLDARVGRDGYAVILTGDHGATPVVERSPHRGARRITPRQIEEAAQAAIVATLGDVPATDTDWVASVSSLNLYFSPALDKLEPARRNDAAAAALAAIRMVPGIADAGFTTELEKCAAGGSLRPLCRSYVAGASGDIYLVPVEGSLITEYTTGTHHDTPTADNRVVPVIVRAPGVAPRTVYRRASMLQIAPTASALLGIPAPPAAQARPLDVVGVAAASAADQNDE
jgi:hypothetical protein